MVVRVAMLHALEDVEQRAPVVVTAVVQHAPDAPVVLTVLRVILPAKPDVKRHVHHVLDVQQHVIQDVKTVVKQIVLLLVIRIAQVRAMAKLRLLFS